MKQKLTNCRIIPGVIDGKLSVTILDQDSGAMIEAEMLSGDPSPGTPHAKIIPSGFDLSDPVSPLKATVELRGMPAPTDEEGRIQKGWSRHYAASNYWSGKGSRYDEIMSADDGGDLLSALNWTAQKGEA